MKALGTIIIILCFGLNLAIGGFLFHKAFLEEQAIHSNASTSPETLTYPELGFSIEIPAGYENVTGTSTEGGLLFAYVKQMNSETWPVIQVFAGKDERLAKNMTEKQYQDYMSTFLAGNKDVTHIQSGFSTTTANLPMYYDIVLDRMGTDIYKEKMYTMYTNGSEIRFLWADAPSQFDSTLPEFEVIINSIRKI